MRSVAQTLTSPERKWTPAPGASEFELFALKADVQLPMPDRYIELLRHSNGGEGPLGIRPGYFQLYDTKFVAQMWRDDFYRTNFPQHLFIGSNGGLETIAFDIAGDMPWALVALDCIAGLESSLLIARDIDEFINALGLEAAHDA